MNTTFLIIDLLSVIVSLFSIYVTYSIYQKYRLARTTAFIIAAINIFLWDLSHVFYDTIPSDNPDAAKIVWVIANISGALIIVATIQGFSSLRNEGLTYSLILYYVIIAIFLTTFLLREDLFYYKYFEDDKIWNSDPKNGVLWNAYIGILFIILTKELFYPLFQAYSKSTGSNKRMILVLIFSMVMAMLSNILLVLDVPQVVRYLIANLGLLGVFWVLFKHPFLGFDDPVEIHQIIIANADGVPIFATSDVVDASLASGALFGISTILDEIGTKAGIEKASEIETTRKIELVTASFFIISMRNSIITYHYSQHTGVCVSKFTSLARLFRDDENDPEELIGVYQSAFVEYYPELSPLIYPS
ncbi:MAG: hypothetical protein ACXAD7_13050 [Candidatus Kariarchaeaceae archaeon]|jgi:hypothetical protein